MNAPLLNAEHILFSVVSFNAKTAEFEGVTAHMVDSWADAYPGKNIDLELTRAECWLLCNPVKRPNGNMLGFLNMRMDQARRQPA